MSLKQFSGEWWSIPHELTGDSKKYQILISPMILPEGVGI
jgi:hypothetical protein